LATSVAVFSTSVAVALLQGGRHSQLEVTKKARKELLSLVMTWGLPPPAEGADIETAADADAAAAAADGGGAAAAAAVVRASEYDWGAWAGSAGEVPAALRKVDDAEMTAMLKVGGPQLV
jgi:hypothetical protein